MNNGTEVGDAIKQQNSAGIAAGSHTLSYLQQANLHPRCECHECTQARWKMSGGGLAQYQNT